MQKAVLFDLDGTLLDTVHDIADKVNIAMEHFGYPTLTTFEIAQRIGNGSRSLIQNSINQEVSLERLQEVLDYFLGIYSGANDPKTKPFDGIISVLTTLRSPVCGLKETRSLLFLPGIV